MKPLIAIVGCGRVGGALARFLHRSGYPFAGLSSRSIASARKVAELCGGPDTADVPEKVTKSADIVFLTTPDGAINEVCAAITENSGFREGCVVLHTSGALGAEVLAPARQAGARVGSMHPMQSFAAVDMGRNPFAGIVVSAEGDKEAVSAAATVSSDLGAVFKEIRSEGKTLYHAAAVAISNYLVTTADLAFSLAEAAGIDHEGSVELFGPLVDGTLENIRGAGPKKALTGPISRGDVATVERHVADIGRILPEMLPLYAALGRGTVAVARAAGTIDEATAIRILDVLDG